MHIRHASVACAVFLLFVGCKKAPADGEFKDVLPLEPETVLRVHWIGKKQLAIDGSAFYFNRIWDLGETRVLEDAVLHALATAPFRLRGEGASVANAPVSSCRILLDALKYEESYLEVRTPAASRAQFVIAVRLSQERDPVWQSNVAMIVSSLMGASPVSSRAESLGWWAIVPQTNDRMQMVRHGEWTVFSIAPDKAEFPRNILEQIDRSPTPFGASKGWLRADVNLNWLARCAGLTNPISGNPIASVSLSGDGANVFTDVTVTFSEPLPGSIGPWELPQELIHEPLTSFAAARGIRPLISQLWNGMPLGDPPNQMFAWSVRGSPFQVYLAAPMPEAEARVERLEDHLFTQVNPWLKNNGPSLGDSGVPLFERLSGAKGVRWNIPGVWPFVMPATAGGKSFLMAGLTPESNPGKPISAARFQQVLAQSNLVYFEWESTPARLNDWLPVLQTARALAHQAPLPDECLTLKWMTGVQHRLAEAQTSVYRVAPNKLQLHRKSTIGFTAAELHLLADWFESPRFPMGLHTFVAPPP